MSEFNGNGSGGGDDGDLQAVVRGFNNSFSTCSSTATILDYPQTCFSPLIIQEDDLFFSSFPDLLCERNAVFDELEELYKPFYPVLNQLSPQASLSSSVSGEDRSEPERVQEKEAFPESTTVAGATPVAGAAPSSSPLAVKYKRRLVGSQNTGILCLQIFSCLNACTLT